MERSKKLEQRSGSAPCGAKRRTVRICIAVMTIAMLVATMVAPASALMIDNELKYCASLAKGNMTFTLGGTPDSVSTEDLRVTTTFGGTMPWINLASTNDLVQHSTFYLPFDDQFNYQQKLNIARRDHDIFFAPSVSYTFHRYRHIVSQTLQEGVSDPVRANYVIVKYDFDPIYLPLFNSSLLENLFILRTANDISISCSVTYSWLGLDNVIHTDTSIHAGNILIPSSSAESGLLDSCIADIIADVGDDPAGAGLYIDDLTVTVTPAGPEGTYLSGVTFDLLCESWTSKPQFYYENPSQRWFEEVQRFMGQNGGSGGGGIPEYPSVEEGPFMQFVVSSVASFFDAEIMPGFSLGGVFSVVFMIVVIILILKFFAGG